MKKTNKTKMGPLGTPLGNPLAYFNSQKGKRSAEPKQKLRKAQDGRAVGPMEKGTVEYLDTKYPGTALKFQGPYSNDYMDNEKEKVAQTYDSFSWGTAADLEDTLRKREEDQIRSWRDDFNSGTGLSKADASMYKKGGTVKKPMMKKGGSVKKMQDGGGILTPDGRIKSNKTRNVNLSYRGNAASTSRTKRDGSTVKKLTQTTNGYAGPSARTVKKVIDKEGNTVSEKQKNISVNSADRKIKRVTNNVGRNMNDSFSYKRGGATKKVTSIKRKK